MTDASPPNFAYVITSYQPPAQVVRLSKAIKALSPTARLVVVSDPGGPKLHGSEVEDHASVVEARQPVAWGAWSFMQMQLDGAEVALARPDVDYVVIISGQDYPLRSLAAFERSVIESRAGAWIERFDQKANYQRQLMRYERRIVPVPAPVATLLRPRTIRRVVNRSRLLHVQDRSRGSLPLVQRRSRAPLPNGMTLTSGNNWWVMRRDAMEVVLGSLERYPDLAAHFSRTFIPSEAYPHTILSAHPELDIDWTRRIQYARWSGWSPEELSLSDLADAWQSGLPFARKFAVDSPALDVIDEQVRQEGAR